MLLILDGPDACGKSTLCRNFTKFALRYGYKVHTIHHTYVKPESKLFQVYMESLTTAEKWIAQGDIVLFDRFWPSELCYSQIYRNGTKLKGKFRVLDRWVQKLGGVYGWVNASSPDQAVKYHKEMHKTGRELYEPDERIKQVAEWFSKLNYESYAELYDEYDYIKYVGTDRQFYIVPREFGAAEIVDLLLTKLLDGRGSWERMCHFHNAVGNFIDPITLLVGDRYGEKHSYSRPFVNLKGSAGWLVDQFENHNFIEDDYCWTNANEANFEDVLRYAEKKVNKIVALGTEAAKKLNRIYTGDLEVAELPHPSYLKRFENGDFTSYLKALNL